MWIKGLCFLVLSSLALAGCGAARQYEAREQAEQLRAKSQTAIADCNVNFPAGNAKIEVARMQCLNTAFAIQMPLFDNDQDLAQVFMADRIVVAEQMQNGKISIAEGNAAIADKWSQSVTESQRRAAIRQSVTAQQAAANAQQAQAFASTLAAINAANPPPTPIAIQQPSTIRLQTTCNRFGTMTTCN